MIVNKNKSSVTYVTGLFCAIYTIEIKKLVKILVILSIDN